MSCHPLRDQAVSSHSVDQIAMFQRNDVQTNRSEEADAESCLGTSTSCKPPDDVMAPLRRSLQTFDDLSEGKAVVVQHGLALYVAGCGSFSSDKPIDWKRYLYLAVLAGLDMKLLPAANLNFSQSLNVKKYRRDVRHGHLTWFSYRGHRTNVDPEPVVVKVKGRRKHVCEMTALWENVLVLLENESPHAR